MNRTLFSTLAFLNFLVLMSVTVQAQQQLPNPYPANAKINYVRVFDAKAPEQNADTLIARPLRDVMQTTQYLDGLGRELQIVVKQGSLVTGDSAKDLIRPMMYDEFGREEYKYLAFVADTVGGNVSLKDGLFKLNPFQQQRRFMQRQYGPQGETYFYARTVYESSPLCRIQEIFAPGDSWVGTSEENNESDRHSVKSKYLFNKAADSVRIWNVSNTAGTFGVYTTTAEYQAGELYKYISVNEHGKQVVTFRNKEGFVILKKVQLTAMPDTGMGKGYAGWLNTYYIYDSSNRQRCIIQPRGVELLLANSWDITALSGVILNEQCFRYEYDYRGRVDIKKLPGTGEVYMVYDGRSRPVMSQDANMRATGKWLVIKYDELNRPIETGLWTHEGSIDLHRTNADHSSVYPLTSNGYEKLTVVHYDNYNGIPDGWNSSFETSWSTYFTGTYNAAPQYAQQQVASSATKGLVTWTQSKVLGTANTFLSTVNIYDDKDRIIQVKATSLAGTDILTTQYDWLGKPLVRVQSQSKSGDNAQTTVVVTRLNYDDLGRIKTVEKRVGNTLINGGSMPTDWTMLAANEYDALGHLKKSILGADLESLTFDYNIQGWMLGVNRSFIDDSSNNYFGYELAFDKIATMISGSTYAAAQYNGNIAGITWKSTGDKEKRKYDFSYDAANRLLFADFNQYTSGAFNKAAGIDFSVKMGNGIDSDSAYDANGNILRMQQWGVKGFSSSLVDDLRYTYNTNSNKLKNVIDLYNDAGTKLGDFRSSTAYMTSLGSPKTNTATDYSYDDNGNLVQDLNKDIVSDTAAAIEYNHLNLPTKIRVKDKGIIEYTYDATGGKLKKAVIQSGADTTVTIYLGGTVFRNDTLQFISHEEGRIRPKGDSALVYDYFISDHLGNVRMVLTEESQEDIYYAGLETADTAVEAKYFMQIPETQSSKPAGFDADAGNQKVSKVMGTASSDKRVGPGVVLKVMAGDKFRAGVRGWYQPDVTNPNLASELGNIVDQLVNAFSGGIPAGGNHGFGSGVIPSSIQLSGPLTDFVDNNNNSSSSAIPKAYLNWIVLDEEQFKLVEGNFGAVQVPEITDSMESQPMLSNGGSDIEVKRNGYLFVYVSNASKGNVYFDELSVAHTRGPLLEETHYYPFGLAMAGVSSKAIGKLENQYKFNSGTELASKEFNDGSGLELYETVFRRFDAQIARFHQIDPISEISNNWTPFAFCNNNPLLFTDPLGLDTTITINGNKQITLTKIEAESAVTVTGRRPKPAQTPSYAFIPGGGIPIQSPLWVKPVEKATTEVVVKTTTRGAATRIGLGSLAKSGSLLVAGLLSPLQAGSVMSCGCEGHNVCVHLKYPQPALQLPSPGDAEQYTLRAKADGYYANFEWGKGQVGVKWLAKGEIWKIGTTSKGEARYSSYFYNTMGLDYVPEFYGPIEQVLFVEKMKLLNYINQYKELPPGNTKLQ